MKLQMKLNYNGFIEHIADVLAAEEWNRRVEE